MEDRMKQGRFSEIGMSRPRKQTRRAVFETTTAFRAG
jgi:hypothetical protein